MADSPSFPSPSTSPAAGRLLRGRFGTIILPAAIFQIVLVGPGFSTGREVVEFAGQFGSLGVWSVLVVLVGFSVLCAIVYELARVLRTHNYRDYIRHLIGPAWPVFDLLWIIFMLIITGLVTSAVGTVLNDTFNIPALLATLAVLVAVAVVLYLGRTMIEGFDLAGSILFSVGISIFALVVLAERPDAVARVFATTNTSFAPNPTVGAAVWSGLLYVAYNIPTSIPVLFCLDRQTRRSQTVTSGILSGFLVALPFALTYLAVLAFYTEGITREEIPWLVMFDKAGGRWLAVLFAVVFTYAVIDTSTSMVHAFLDRIDSALVERRRRGITNVQRGFVILAVLLAAFVLSRFGVIDLVARGYGYLAYGFLLVFVLPLVTRGLYLIAKHGRGPRGSAVSPGS